VFHGLLRLEFDGDRAFVAFDAADPDPRGVSDQFGFVTLRVVLQTGERAETDVRAFEPADAFQLDRAAAQPAFVADGEADAVRPCSL